jgi:hypothetical protein
MSISEEVKRDTDFSLTGKFDEWDQAGVTFNFGMDASAKLVGLAQSLAETQWRGLMRAEPEIKTEPRERPENVKDQIVRSVSSSINGWRTSKWRSLSISRAKPGTRRESAFR